MCDCNEFLHLLASYEARLTNNDAKHSALLKNEIEIIFGYTQAWPQRQCMCIYRDPKNFERFNLVIQSMICFSVYNMKNIKRLIDELIALTNPNPKQLSPEPNKMKIIKEPSLSEEENRKKDEFYFSKHEERWILPEVEKLLVLVSKTFLLNFPLYIAYKHGVHLRLDEISSEEAQNLSTFCDLHDNEIPVFLLRNVALFCNSGGFQAMMLCFEQSNLPVTTAHAITATVSNVKLWLNYRCILQLFLPLRSTVLHYMCKLSDQDLRSAAARSMADFVWSAIRDPLDSSINFDVEGLALAYKYFTSSTLTMRLAGMAQINAHINLFNEICTTETVGEVEVVGQKLGDWLTENQIIQHLFGPNLHVEVIKQSHIVLNFLAVENQITEEHINLIWQAAQLKHCSKPVYDILPSLVKNLAPRPAMHLYSLLCRLDPKEHTEQSIYIISALTKLIWSRDGVRSQYDLSTEHQLTQSNAVAVSSENSVSIDGSNTEEEQQDDDSSSVSHKSNIEIEGNDCSDFGAPPCKQARRKRYECSDDFIKMKKRASKIQQEELKKFAEDQATAHAQKVRNLSNSDENTSTDDDSVPNEEINRKKIRKRRKNNNTHLTRLAHEFVEAIWENESNSDAEVGIVDSDCSDPSQIPRRLSMHNPPGGPFIRAIGDSHLNELLSGGENDESYSSPMSNKSEKNMADFDEDSPCEEELAQLVNKNHNCLPSFSMPIAVRDNTNKSGSRGSNTSVANGSNTTKANSSGATQDESTNSDKIRKSRKSTSNAKIEEISSTPGNVSSGSISCTASGSSSKEESSPVFKISDVCKPGNTLLWDLLQDDKIGLLGESLALEAEKALSALLCFSTNKLLRTKFIEGCLQNLAANRTVIVSLRLLPKLFASFQQFRSSDTHQLTLWAERQHKMMFHFFNNIKFYANSVRNNFEGQVLKENNQPMYSHITQVQVRLQFLTSVFSCLGSPKSFRLSLEQVDALWDWLANDSECADCLFAWLQVQAKGIEQHALGIETLQHLYLKKLPELKPEGISMVALGLFQQLCSLARLAIAHYEKQSGLIEESTASAANIVGMNHLWKIALRAHNTEVSLAAIQYINSFYMGQQLKLEKEFVSQCMDHLIIAAEDLKTTDNQDHALMCVQRALMLLNTHLETFRRRYAFHLRRWALEGKGIGSHSNLRNEGSGPSIRIILQPAGLSEKSILHMHAGDLIAELKAEISKWWETLQGGAKNTGVSAPVLGLLLSEGPLRIITQGQELTSEYDERSLADVGFKDNQIIYVSLGGRGARRKEPLDHPTLQPPPPRECLPTVLLLQPKYLEELFYLMQTLGDMKMHGKCTNFQPHIKAQILSRRIWDILAILPTNPNLLEAFKSLNKDLQAVQGNGNFESPNGHSDIKNPGDRLKQKISELLDPSNLQKFMYSLYIVETLALKSKQQQNCCGTPTSSSSLSEPGNFKCIQPKLTHRSGNNGIPKSPKPNSPVKKSSSDEAEKSGEDQKKNYFSDENIGKENRNLHSNKDSEDESIKDTKSQDSQDEKENFNEIEQLPLSENSSKEDTSKDLEWIDVFIKCGGMQHLFDIFISGLLQNSYHSDDKYNEWRHDCLASLLRIICILGFEELKPDEMLLVLPKPHPFMLEMMEVDSTLKRLASILHDESVHQHSLNQLQLRTGFWGRAQIVQFVMNILVSFVHVSSEARELLWSKPEYSGWLQKFILDDPEPAVRREICAGIYRICLGNSKTFSDLLGPLLRKLVSFLPIAEKMTTHYYTGSITQHIVSAHHEEGKEPYGPACRDYFWLLARLVDTLSPEMIKECFEENSRNFLDIEQLCANLAKSILDRDFYETRQGLQDDGLVGLINLMTNLIKYDPPFKYSQLAQTFIDNIFLFLFDLPSAADRQKPKCKSQASRAAAYDLLVELCKNAPQNYQILHKKLIEQHRPGPHPPYPWDYWPRDDGRSECGYVGLTNLGATCYMASCIQHLYMMPQARRAILSAPPQMAKKHGQTLHELQRMFAYLLESERKSYNPRSFCRVYQMDHQPLNTGEQKDMAEFFIDLVSKLEEMTPELKALVKKLFSGTQSNNVVSLDCGHVSRTAEEFYTVRCQVADMRNLQESLDEVTVKDTLEGDNMYTCSQCGKKVRAEKRACFKKLPHILCFNTMRYTFNMLTMLKEKVNTHFSFPMRLDMSDYVEKTLMPQQYQEDKQKKRELREKLNEAKKENSSAEDIKIHDLVESDDEDDEQSGYYEYDLIGITVHTGTADGGHYYSFIKERNELSSSSYQQHSQNSQHHPQEKWFLFNDAEVKPFDPSQIASECFGGEMTSKTYDSVTEKYLDFSFEKTNSAYMLFYERRIHLERNKQHNNQLIQQQLTHQNSIDIINCNATTSTAGIENEASSQQQQIGIDLQNETENNILSSKKQNINNNNSNLNDNVCDIDVSSRSNENVSPKSINLINSSVISTSSPSSISPPSCSSSTGAIVQQQKLQGNDRNAGNDPNRIILNKELEDWIWQDNKQFLQDKNIFEHTYFNFMWQICGHIPQTLLTQTDVTCMAAQLSVSFFIETFIHAKEKPTMVLWVELLTKQFNASQEACEWFLTHMAAEPWWPVQVLIQCPNQMVRQMFQRLVIHVIQRLRPSHFNLYLKSDPDEEGKDIIGNHSCVTKFIKSLIHLMEHGAKSHLRHLSEFFGLLYEFSRMGDEEALFLLRINVIRSVADFYLGNKTQDCLDTGSGDDENSSDEALSIDKARPASLDKMIALVASLVERSRGPDFRLHLSPKDYNAIAGGKGFPFLYQQIRDNINPHQTRHLIHALCRWDERLANQIITMLFSSVTKHTELCGPFFKLLTLLTETQGGPSGLPCFSQLVLQRVWDAAEYCPQSALDWLAVQAPRNKIIHAWILQSAENWVEQFLIAHNNSRVRNAASFLLISLVPSQSFRANYRTHSLHKLVSNAQHRELNGDAQIILHNIINLLLRLLRAARVYTDIAAHGTAKLTAYFTLLTYCMVSKTEKLMLGPYMRTLWDLFHPRLSEPSVPAHHNKHALLAFWHHAITECPENAQIVANCPEITRNIAFNYILADHDDSEIVAYNRAMLPAYYGLLRLCCQQSRSLTRQLAAHQNLQWAFKNITPHPTQYPAAVDELFRLMTLFAARHPDASEQEEHEINTFRRTTLSAYLSSLDGRVSWGTLISALRILVDNDEDRLFVVYNGGIEMCFDALHTLHSMYHEATACHVSGDLQELLSELLLLVLALRLSCRITDSSKSPTQTQQQQSHQQRQQSPNHRQQQTLPQMPSTSSNNSTNISLAATASLTPNIKGLSEAVKRLATFLNTYNPPEIRNLTLDVFKEMVRNPGLDVTSVLAPVFTHCHYSAQNSPNSIGPLGPYFPRRGTKTPWPTMSKNTPRPPRPMVQMSIPQNQIIQKGIDKEYDCHLMAFYRPYHDFLDVMMRMAVNTNQLNELLVKLSCLAAIEAAPLHFNLFPKFWVGIYNNKSTNKYVELLLNTPVLVEYVDILLRDERISLNDPIIRNFLEIYYPKVESVTTRLAISRLLYAISYTLHTKDDIDDLFGDLYAIRIIAQSTGIPLSVRKQIRSALKVVLDKHKSDIYDHGDDVVPPKKKVKISNIEFSENFEKSDKKTNESESEAIVPSKISSPEIIDTEMKINQDKIITSSPNTENNNESNIFDIKNENTKLNHSSTVESPISPIQEPQNSSPQSQTNKSQSNSEISISKDEEIHLITNNRPSTPTETNSCASGGTTSRSKSSIDKSSNDELNEKEKGYVKSIESFVKNLLDIIQDEDDEDSSQPSSSSSSSTGSHNSFSAQTNSPVRKSNSPVVSLVTTSVTNGVADQLAQPNKIEE